MRARNPRRQSPLKSSAHSHLVHLQRRIYRSLEREARSLLGDTPAAIQKYERERNRDFLGRHTISTRQQLIDAVRAADVTWIGDYHTLGQSQRTALRIMRDAVKSGENWMIGLELIPSQYQDVLDRYQAGRLSLEAFHAKIRYREEWGFPWKNYAPIFEWARKHSVRIIALNRPRALIYRDFKQDFTARETVSSVDLHERDLWAAGIVTDQFAEAQRLNSGRLRMLVLYGELHAARAHLAAKLTRVSLAFLNKPLRSLSIHQNHDATYWRLAEKERELHAQVLKLGSDAWCVLTTPPWARLQSLIASIEGQDLEDSDGPDDLYWMKKYGETIASFLGLRCPSFESVTLKTIENADFVESLDPKRGDSTQLAQSLMGANQRFYLPGHELAYLAVPSLNGVAELAALHVYHSQKKSSPPASLVHAKVLESAFAFLGSLILNPRRKCDLRNDLKRRIRQLHAGARASHAGELDARQLAVALLDRRQADTHTALTRTLGARYAGRALAKALHPLLLSSRHGGAEFNRIVKLLLESQTSEAALLELLQLCKRPKKRPVLKKEHYL